MSKIIEINNFSLLINEKQLLKNINFTGEEKVIYTILGKNGAGKSLLLKSIGGLHKPTQGTINIFDKNIYSTKADDLNKIRKNIGYLFQKSGLFDSLNILDNVIFPMTRLTSMPNNEKKNKALALLHSTGLKNIEQKLPSQLSGGMLKRAGIARAIALDPAILLLDDPTAGLDPVLSDAIADLILDIHKRLNNTIIIVTHDLKIAKKVSTRILLMNQGEILYHVDNEDFFSSDNPYMVQYREKSLTGPIKNINEELFK